MKWIWNGFIMLCYLMMLMAFAWLGEISWNLPLGVLLAVITGIFMLSMFRLGQWMGSTRCPGCGRFFCNRPVGSAVLGIFKKYEDPDSLFDGIPGDPPRLVGVPHLKMKTRFRCAQCGSEWDKINFERVHELEGQKFLVVSVLSMVILAGGLSQLFSAVERLRDLVQQDRLWHEASDQIGTLLQVPGGILVIAAGIIGLYRAFLPYSETGGNETKGDR